MVIAGIDYSLSSPAICVHEGKEWDYKNCTFYYLVSKEKFLNKEDSQYLPTLYPQYREDMERFDKLAEWSISICLNRGVDIVSLEGYAFGAVGRVFQIAENAGLLKYKLWEQHIGVDVYAPTMIKKFATDKGNCNKEMMIEAFENESGVDIREKCGIINKQWNPISDIADSYYMAKFGFHQIFNLEKDV